VVSIFAAILMLFPGMSMASPIQSNVHQYQVGREKVIFKGNQAFIAFGNSLGKVSWTIEKMTQSGLKAERLAHFRIKRIVNAYQNSAVLIENNSQVRIAEIYSFNQGSIDASIAVKNLNLHNATYVATFVVVTNHREHVSTFGFSGRSISLPISQKTVFAPISSRSWIYRDQNIQISWKNEMALFHSGILMSDTKNNIVSLPFGPFTISNNETTSIDPVIRPDRIIGGGGGGGGSSGSPPTASLGLPGVSSTNDAFVYGTSITLAADVSSMGTPDPVSTTYVTMDFYGLTSSGGQTFLFQKTVTSTGTFDYTWTPAPGYYTGVKMTYGGYWGQGTPSQVNQVINVYDNLVNTGTSNGPTDASNALTIYNTLGQSLGTEVIQVETGVVGPFTSGYTTQVQFESSFVPTTTYTNSLGSAAGITNYTDQLKWTGNSFGSTSSQAVSLGVAALFDEASQNTTTSWGPGEYALWSAFIARVPADFASGAAILSAIGVLYFSSLSGNIPPTTFNDLQVPEYPSGLSAVFDRSIGEPSWIFDVLVNINFQIAPPQGSLTASTAALNYFVYSSSLTLNDATGGDTFILSEPLIIGED
jgi:hypothetical protein